MGGRMVRGRSLSDDRVISFVNQNFVAIDVNCNEGFPPNTRALEGYKRFYEMHHTPGQGEGTEKFSRGFTASLIMTPDGSTIINKTQRASVTDDWQNNDNYNPVGYLSFLQNGIQGWRSKGAR